VLFLFLFRDLHLNDWPEISDSLIDEDLEKEIEITQSIIQSILAGREKIQRGLRWPVKEVILTTKEKEVRDSILRTKEIIKSQTNIKSLKIVDKLETIKNVVKSDFKKLGPEFGELAAKIIARLAQESADTIIQHIEKDGNHIIELDGKKIELKKDHLIFERISPENLAEASFKQGFVYVNKEMDSELEAEGLSRELMRRVQSLRKNAGLEKKDEIILVVKAEQEIVDMFLKWEKQISDKVGAKKVKISTENPARNIEAYSEEKVKGKHFEIWIEKTTE
jgi:isoleucyl-tRNA synthetase